MHSIYCCRIPKVPCTRFHVKLMLVKFGSALCTSIFVHRVDGSSIAYCVMFFSFDRVPRTVTRTMAACQEYNVTPLFIH